MALFGLGRKPQDIPPLPPQDQYPPVNPSPVDIVLQLRQQGLSNNQIVQTLQRDGYASDQIFDAINQADIKGSFEPYPAEQMQPMRPIENSMPPPQMPEQQYPPMQQQHEPVEQLVEAIVNERWEEISKEINKIAEWRDRTDARLAKMEQSMQDMRGEFDRLHQALIGKIQEYDQNILNVGTEIKAMEKVFQKVLPQFTQNINELNRITKSIDKKA